LLPFAGELLLGYNRLTGSFPDFLFGEKSVLENLVLSRNALKGPMAPFISSTLKRLELEVNSLTGPIPSTFGTLQNLSKFSSTGALLPFFFEISVGTYEPDP